MTEQEVSLSTGEHEDEDADVGGNQENEATNQKSTREIEKVEEEKLKSKFPMGIRPGHSAFLQNRLQKGSQKYFDSGDYQMAKQKSGGKTRLAQSGLTGDAMPNIFPTGEKIPTKESVPIRKTSIIQPTKFTPNQ